MPSRRPRTPAVSVQPRRVAVYVRVSTAREDMISPELQKNAIETFINQQSIVEGRPWVVAATEEDLDMSGGNFARAGIRKLIKGVEDGHWDRIIVYNYTRFGRNLADSLTQLGKVELARGQVLSASEPFDTSTSMGTFSRSLILALAQLQRDQIRDSWIDVGRRRLRLGLPPGGNSRWGYVYHSPKSQRPCPLGCAPGTCTVGYVPDATLGPILAECYRMVIRGDGIAAVTEWLISSGYQTSRNGMWNVTTVSRMLDSGFGAGLVKSHDPDNEGEFLYLRGTHPAVITRREWERYKRVRTARRGTPPRARAPKWSLVGIAKCGICGAGLNSVRNKPLDHTAKSSHLVRCSRRLNQGRSSCTGVYISEWACDEAAFLAVKGWLETVAQVAAAVQTTTPARPAVRSPLEMERRRLQRVLDQHPAKRERLGDALASGRMTVEEYVRRIDTIEADVAAATARLAELDDAAVTRPTVPPLMPGEFAQWRELPSEVKNSIVRAFLDKVVVYPGSVRDDEGKRLPLHGPRIRVIYKPGIE